MIDYSGETKVDIKSKFFFSYRAKFYFLSVDQLASDAATRFILLSNIYKATKLGKLFFNI